MVFSARADRAGGDAFPLQREVEKLPKGYDSDHCRDRAAVKRTAMARAHSENECRSG